MPSSLKKSSVKIVCVSQRADWGGNQHPERGCIILQLTHKLEIKHQDIKHGEQPTSLLAFMWKQCEKSLHFGEIPDLAITRSSLGHHSGHHSGHHWVITRSSLRSSLGHHSEWETVSACGLVPSRPFPTGWTILQAMQFLKCIYFSSLITVI